MAAMRDDHEIPITADPRWQQVLERALGDDYPAAEIVCDGGRGCATHPVAVVIPCHPAVSTGGKLTGYRWGLRRKKKLLAGERGD